jgi:hypothetical protein
MKLFLVIALAALLAVPAASAGVTVGINDTYVDVDDSGTASLWSESNGKAGLQKSETCDADGRCTPADTQVA